MTRTRPITLSGNRCGHDPQKPRLRPLAPIKNDLGQSLNLQALAAARAKNWFSDPDLCPPLKTNPERRRRSERREACQIVLEVLLNHLDLASLSVGRPPMEEYQNQQAY